MSPEGTVVPGELTNVKLSEESFEPKKFFETIIFCRKFHFQHYVEFLACSTPPKSLDSKYLIRSLKLIPWEFSKTNHPTEFILAMEDFAYTLTVQG